MIFVKTAIMQANLISRGGYTNSTVSNTKVTVPRTAIQSPLDLLFVMKNIIMKPVSETTVITAAVTSITALHFLPVTRPLCRSLSFAINPAFDTISS